MGTSGPDVIDDPTAHPAQLVIGVVVSWHDQCGQFDPEISGGHGPLDGLEHRIEIAATHLPVVLVREALEVDVHRIHHPEQFLAWTRFDVAGGHPHRPHALGATGERGIDGVLEEHNRVVVGERHAAAPEPHRGVRDGLRRGAVGQRVDVPGLRDVPVLTELAGQVASGGAEGEHRSPGQEVVQRLLLDGVDAVSAGATVGRRDDPVAFAGPDETQPALPFVQPTGPGTDVALHPAVVEQMPVLRLGDLTERRAAEHLRPHTSSGLPLTADVKG
jgi:hypothetical protein